MTDFTSPKEMSVTEYRETVAALGLSHSAAARFLGVVATTGMRYANQGGIPPATATLLRLMVRAKMRPETVRAVADRE